MSEKVALSLALHSRYPDYHALKRQGSKIAWEGINYSVILTGEQFKLQYVDSFAILAPKGIELHLTNNLGRTYRTNLLQRIRVLRVSGRWATNRDLLPSLLSDVFLRPESFSMDVMARVEVQEALVEHHAATLSTLRLFMEPAPDESDVLWKAGAQRLGATLLQLPLLSNLTLITHDNTWCDALIRHGADTALRSLSLCNGTVPFEMLGSRALSGLTHLSLYRYRFYDSHAAIVQAHRKVRKLVRLELFILSVPDDALLLALQTADALPALETLVVHLSLNDARVSAASYLTRLHAIAEQRAEVRVELKMQQLDVNEELTQLEAEIKHLVQTTQHPKNFIVHDQHSPGCRGATMFALPHEFWR